MNQNYEEVSRIITEAIFGFREPKVDTVGRKPDPRAAAIKSVGLSFENQTTDRVIYLTKTQEGKEPDHVVRITPFGFDAIAVEFLFGKDRAQPAISTHTTHFPNTALTIALKHIGRPLRKLEYIGVPGQSPDDEDAEWTRDTVYAVDHVRMHNSGLIEVVADDDNDLREVTGFIEIFKERE